VGTTTLMQLASPGGHQNCGAIMAA